MGRDRAMLGALFAAWITSGAQLAPTIQCTLDTDLPLSELSVSVEEKRELVENPDEDGRLVLRDLPEGDLHLLFDRGEERLGRIAIRDAREGQLIRITVRLVPGNAILLDEYRVKGIEDRVPGETQRAIEKESAPDAPGERRTSDCPDVGETVRLEGTIARSIDRERFELRASGRTYVVYVGSATRLLDGSRVATPSDLEEGAALALRGVVAAGPEDECSIAAREIRILSRAARHFASRLPARFAMASSEVYSDASGGQYGAHHSR